MGGSVTGVAAHPVAADSSNPQQLPAPHGIGPLAGQYLTAPPITHAQSHTSDPSVFLQLTC